jgi:hypothetical protein
MYDTSEDFTDHYDFRTNTLTMGTRTPLGTLSLPDTLRSIANDFHAIMYEGDAHFDMSMPGDDPVTIAMTFAYLIEHRKMTGSAIDEVALEWIGNAFKELDEHVPCLAYYGVHRQHPELVGVWSDWDVIFELQQKEKLLLIEGYFDLIHVTRNDGTILLFSGEDYIVFDQTDESIVENANSIAWVEGDYEYIVLDNENLTMAYSGEYPERVFLTG